MESPQGCGPPEVAIKIAFQYLHWGDHHSFRGEHKIFNKAPLVCKSWKNMLETDDVGRPLCVNQLRYYDNIVATRNRNLRARAEENGTDFEEEVWFSPTHQLLARLVDKQPPPGRTYKDCYILSEKMGKLLSDYKFHGPDSTAFRTRRRTLRDACSQDFQRLVVPTIERLRQVFDDPNKSEREQDIEAMKNRLLNHARSGGSVLRRAKPCYLEKEELAETIGQYALMLAASNSCDENMFIASSAIAASLGDIVQSVETFTGEKLTTSMRLQLKKKGSEIVREFTYLPIGGNSWEDETPTKKGLCMSLGDLNWPISPVDCMSFLIRKCWPNDADIMDFGDAPEEKDKKVDEHLRKWWLGLDETIRKLLVSIHRKLSERFNNVEPLPANVENTSDIPTEAVKLLLELKYQFVRKEMVEQIWRDLRPGLDEQILEVYKQHASMFVEMIRQDYNAIYDGAKSLEHNARVLLDILLEVPRHFSERALLTAEHCEGFLGRVDEVMTRWNELVEQINTDEGALWNPEILTELKSFEPMFGLRDSRREETPTLDYCVPQLVKVCLYQTLSSKQQMPDIQSLEDGADKFGDDIRERRDENGNLRLLSWAENVEFNARAEDLVQKFRSLSAYIHTRERALMALIPLLSHLSAVDAKKLIYALFIERTKKNFDGDVWSGVWCGEPFSATDMNFGSLFSRDLPVAKDDVSDLSLLVLWGGSKRIGGGRNCYRYWNDDGTLGRLFGLPLPENIIRAMGTFMVEQLYQSSINDLNEDKASDSLGVERFLKRFCYEYPEKSHIVSGYISQALENAISVVTDRNADDIGEQQQKCFQSVVMTLVSLCVEISARSLAPILRRLYEGTQFQLLPDIIPLDTLLERMDETPSGVIVDTRFYHSLFHDEQL